MNKNRFDLLNIDDDSDEQHNLIPGTDGKEIKEEQVVIQPIAKKPETRQWSLDNDKPQELREWNIEKTKFNQHRRKSPFQHKHHFKYHHNDNERKYFSGYSFKDDVSEQEETKKPPTPIHKDIEFPKLNESSNDIKKRENPEVQTFAEKIRLAMEKESQKPKEEKESKHTIHMFSVIPMKTKLGDSLQFLS